LISQKMFRF